MLTLGDAIEAVATFPLTLVALEAHYKHDNGHKDDDSTRYHTSNNIEIGGCSGSPRHGW